MFEMFGLQWNWLGDKVVDKFQVRVDAAYINDMLHRVICMMVFKHFYCLDEIDMVWTQ